MSGYYGPTGYTDAIRTIVEPWLEGDVLDAERFGGLPAALAQHIVRVHVPAVLAHVTVEGDPPMWELVSLAVTLPDAHLHGYIIGPPREDERLTFTHVCWRARKCPLPDLIADYPPAALETHDGWITAWWH